MWLVRVADIPAIEGAPSLTIPLNLQYNALRGGASLHATPAGEGGGLRGSERSPLSLVVQQVVE